MKMKCIPAKLNKKKCPMCKRLFDSIHSHCVKKHSNRFVCCPICFEVFKLSESNCDFVEHSDLMHQRQIKKAAKEIKAEDFAPITKYRIGADIVKNSQCMACLKCFSDRSHAAIHYKHVHLAIKYLCHECPSVFNTLRYLRSHYNAKHGSQAIEFAGFATSEKQNIVKVYEEMNTFNGFQLCERDDADKASERMNAICRFGVSKMEKQRAISTSGIGIRILNNSFQFFPETVGSSASFELAFRKKNGVVKLRSIMMDDTNEFIDLTTCDDEMNEDTNEFEHKSISM